MRPLLANTDDQVKLLDAIDAIEGDLSKIPDEFQAEFEARLDAVGAEEAAILDDEVRCIKHLEMEVAACDAEIQQWQARVDEWKARKNRKENHAAWRKANIKRHLERTKRLEAYTASGYRVVIQKNGGSRPIEWNEPLELDKFTDFEEACFIDSVPVVNKTAVREYLEKPDSQPLMYGKVLTFAKLGERGTSLRIK